MIKYIMVIVSVLLLSTACKKEIKLPPDPEPPAPTNPDIPRTDEQKLKDSVYYYYKLYSLWTKYIAPVDPISTFTDQYNTEDHVLHALKGQTPSHNGYNGPIDKFSFLDHISAGSNSARADNADGYGIFITILWESGAPVGHIHTFFVEGGSPAGQVGVKRGDRIISVNGRTNLTVPIDNGNITDGTNYNFVLNALEDNQLELEVERTDGTTHIYSMDYQTYPIYPILKDTIYEHESKKIGYLALSSFEEVYDSHGRTPLLDDFEAVFSRFEQENIDDLILDFRYNIGGYVHTAEYLANKIINNEGDKKLMYQYETNEYLISRESGRRHEFSDVFYNKDNNLNIRNLYFLATENTASASEILISATAPYFEHVEIIAETNRTHGKPVGYFPQSIMDKVDLWVASFKAFHPEGYKDYWDGIPATKPNVMDDILKDFGDPEEAMIAEALSHATTGVYTSSSSQQQSRSLRSPQAASPPIKVIEGSKLKPRNLIKK